MDWSLPLWLSPAPSRTKIDIGRTRQVFATVTVKQQPCQRLWNMYGRGYPIAA
jgi:hypothetical protein